MTGFYMKYNIGLRWVDFRVSEAGGKAEEEDKENHSFSGKHFSLT